MNGHRAEILRLVDAWQVPMYLGGWQLRVHFPRRMKELASCESLPEYLQADLSFNLARLRREIGSEAELRELVAHEMAHPHTEALADLALKGTRSPAKQEAIRKAGETLTTVMSRMVLPHLP